jgi:hypothetical protein
MYLDELARRMLLCGILVAPLSCSEDVSPSSPTASGGSGGTEVDADLPPDAGESDGPVGPVDDTAPVLRDVQVDIEGPLSAGFDIDEQDASLVLAADTTALFTVFARDDSSAAEELTVEVVVDDGDPLPAESSELRSGLWRVRVRVQRGLSLRVRVSDAAGNAVLSEGRLVLPSAPMALTGSWQARFHSSAQSISHRWNAVWTEDTWEVTEEDSGVTRSGSYSVLGSIMTLSQTRSSGGETEDDEPSSI